MCCVVPLVFLLLMVITLNLMLLMIGLLVGLRVFSCVGLGWVFVFRWVGLGFGSLGGWFGYILVVCFCWWYWVFGRMFLLCFLGYRMGLVCLLD